MDTLYIKYIYHLSNSIDYFHSRCKIQLDLGPPCTQVVAAARQVERGVAAVVRSVDLHHFFRVELGHLVEELDERQGVPHARQLVQGSPVPGRLGNLRQAVQVPRVAE